MKLKYLKNLYNKLRIIYNLLGNLDIKDKSDILAVADIICAIFKFVDTSMFWK